ncbi:DNA helicase Pif1 like protein, partial [Lentinula raphanica]
KQHQIFDLIFNAVQTNSSLLCFIDGKAGCGKTTLIHALCNYLRAYHRIVLATATSAFAAQQYPGGCTTHSTFKV